MKIKTKFAGGGGRPWRRNEEEYACWMKRQKQYAYWMKSQ
ncbi:hypothetical protein MTO96_032305, partial [Rhipicephalus appendiculatus]